MIELLLGGRDEKSLQTAVDAFGNTRKKKEAQELTKQMGNGVYWSSKRKSRRTDE